MGRRPKCVLAYLLCGLCSVTPSVRTLNSSRFWFSFNFLIIWTRLLLGGATPLVVHLQYLPQRGSASVLSRCKIKVVTLSPSFEGGSFLWRIVCCANILHCLTWLWQPQSNSGYRCWFFSTLYQSSLICHPITLISVVLHFLGIYDNIWSLLQKADFHTKIIKVRCVWKVGILM